MQSDERKYLLNATKDFNNIYKEIEPIVNADELKLIVLFFEHADSHQGSGAGIVRRMSLLRELLLLISLAY